MFFNPPDSIDPSRVRRALVIKLRNHGDVLLTSPVFTVLKAAAPESEIDALVHADTAPMLVGHPAISCIHEVARKQSGGLIQRLLGEGRLLRTLHSRSYDLVIHLTDGSHGAWIARLLRPIVSVAPEKKGRRWYRNSFTHLYPVIGGNRRHTVEIHLDALRRLGIYPMNTLDKRLILVPGEEADTRAAALLRDAGLAPNGYVLIHPGSRWLFKCWRPEAMAAVADALADEGYRIVVTGAPDSRERALADTMIASMHHKPVNLCGQTGLRELAALIREANLFLGVDSVPMHIAAAMQTPTVALFGPSGDIEWGSWMSPHEIVRSDAYPCRPCGKDGCGGSKRSDCLDVLSVATVKAACDRQLGRVG
jgi:heptosyltransferase-3